MLIGLGFPATVVVVVVVVVVVDAERVHWEGRFPFSG